MELLIDSFAWMEFFKGTERGRRVYRLLEENAGAIATTAANIYELYYRLEQEFGRPTREKHLAFVKSVAEIVPINEMIARAAGAVRLTHGLSAVDAFAYAAAQLRQAKVVTGDKDFRGLPGVIEI